MGDDTCPACGSGERRYRNYKGQREAYCACEKPCHGYTRCWNAWHGEPVYEDPLDAPTRALLDALAWSQKSVAAITPELWRAAAKYREARGLK